MLNEPVLPKEEAPEIEEAVSRVLGSLKHLIVMHILMRKWKIFAWIGLLMLAISVWMGGIMLLVHYIAMMTFPLCSAPV